MSAVRPSLGPVEGGSLISLFGINLGSGTDYRCSFGANATAVAASYNQQRRSVECLSPPLAAGSHVVRVSLNGQSYSAVQSVHSSAAPVTFIALSPPSISGVTTSASSGNATTASGPRWGGTLVSVSGSGFAFGATATGTLAGAPTGDERCRRRQPPRHASPSSPASTSLPLTDPDPDSIRPHLLPLLLPSDSELHWSQQQSSTPHRCSVLTRPLQLLPVLLLSSAIYPSETGSSSPLYTSTAPPRACPMLGPRQAGNLLAVT